jgi:hypothetical protein
LKFSSRFSLLFQALAIAIPQKKMSRGMEWGGDALVLVLSSAAVLATLSLVLRHVDGARSGDNPRVKSVFAKSR